MVRSLDRQFNFKSFVRTVLLSSLALTAILGGIRQLGVFEESELAAYDRFIQNRQPPPLDDRIVVVGITEKDIRQRQEYPLQDGTLAELLKIIEAYEPLAIGLDIARDIPQGTEEGRTSLTETIQKSDRIISACILSDLSQAGVAPAPGTPPERVGFAEFPQDPGGIVRRSTLIGTPGKFQDSSIAPFVPPNVCNAAVAAPEIPSLSFKLAQMYLAAQGVAPEESGSGLIQLGQTILQPLNTRSGGYVDNDIPNYQILLNYRSNHGTDRKRQATRKAVQEVSLTQVLEGRIKESLIRDRIVLLGYTSPVAKDILITPYDETLKGFRGMPGVIVHAQAVSQILSAVLDERPLLTTRSEPVEILWIWFWAIVGGAIAFHRRHLLLTGFMVGGAITACWWSCWYLFQTGLWIPLAPSLWAIATTSVVVMLLNQARRGGYTQAIYEQIRAQLDGRLQSTSMAGSDSIGYLENLIQRAQAIRQGEEKEVESSADLLPEASVAQDEFELDFSNPEQREIYEQIRAEVEEELLAEQQARSTLRQQEDGRSSQQLQDLIHRARAARQDESSPYRSSD